MNLHLSFDSDIDAKMRARIGYAFRVFAAVYGHRVDGSVSSSGPLVHVRYGASEIKRDSVALVIPALYAARVLAARSVSPITVAHGQEEFALILGVDYSSGQPDWLGEVFEWVSGATESSIDVEDSAGRVPFEQSIFRRYGISPVRAHAARVLSWLEEELRAATGNPCNALPSPPSPVTGARHVVVCSHDIDYYYTGTLSALVRLTKNAAIAALSGPNQSFFAETMQQFRLLASGKKIGHFLPSLLADAATHRYRSTLFVMARRAHRRDANYDLAEIAPWIRKAAVAGFDIGLHGSYRSVIEDDSLAEERSIVRELTGSAATGNRQHWLRFATQRSLVRQVQRAGFSFDSSLGFSASVGFRNGAAFPFPPYDFDNEAAATFLEFPLVIMDTTLTTAKLTGSAPEELANAVLSESRRWGWGGVSILWHNPIEALGVGPEINEVFAALRDSRGTYAEVWLSGDELMRVIRDRYLGAGLPVGNSA